MALPETEGAETYASDVTFAAHHQGGPGIAHGGIVGAALEIAGELRDGEELLAEADGAFLHVPLEHFLATPEGRAAAEAWRQRLEDAPNE
jgi:hypothetical protein